MLTSRFLTDNSVELMFVSLAMTVLIEPERPDTEQDEPVIALSTSQVVAEHAGGGGGGAGVQLQD